MIEQLHRQINNHAGVPLDLTQGPCWNRSGAEKQQAGDGSARRRAGACRGSACNSWPSACAERKPSAALIGNVVQRHPRQQDRDRRISSTQGPVEQARRRQLSTTVTAFAPHPRVSDLTVDPGSAEFDRARSCPRRPVSVQWVERIAGEARAVQLIDHRHDVPGDAGRRQPRSERRRADVVRAGRRIGPADHQTRGPASSTTAPRMSSSRRSRPACAAWRRLRPLQVVHLRPGQAGRGLEHVPFHTVGKNGRPMLAPVFPLVMAEKPSPSPNSSSRTATISRWPAGALLSRPR